mgnify:CR=1 FL=1
MQKLNYASYLKMTKEESSDCLRKKGYQKYPEFGWIKEERLQEVINMGLIKESDGEYMLTRLGAKYNTLNYIGGNDNLKEYQDVIKSKKKETIDEIFEGTN